MVGGKGGVNGMVPDERLKLEGEGEEVWKARLGSRKCDDWGSVMIWGLRDER